jgi:hypothetical protein
MMSRCACGGNMIKVWDTELETWRVKCDNPRHNPDRHPPVEDDPLVRLLKTPGVIVRDMSDLDPRGIL